MKDIKALIESRLRHIKKVRSENVDLAQELVKISKYELHVHLGGSIRRSTIVDLAEKNGVSLPAPKKEFLEVLTPLSFFTGDRPWELFHNTFKWYWSCVKSCDDLKRIVFEFLEDSYRQGIVHSEFTISSSYLMKTFPFDEWLDAVSLGISEAQKKYPIKAAAIFDISRRFGPENALKNVKQVSGSGSKTLCAIGMGGDEVKYPHKLFVDTFDYARNHNIPYTVHVAEFRSGETTIDVIKDLKPNRLGHAVTTIQSKEAYRFLVDSGLHVESCPLCNYVARMGGVDSIAKHPIKKYYEDGIPISINTDNPGILGFDMTDSYVILMKESGFDFSDFEKINKGTGRYSFISH